MISYPRFRHWMDNLDLKSFAGLTLAAVCIIAMAVFGVMPGNSLLFVNAFLSGTVWGGCVVLLLVGGKRLDALLTASLCLVAGGLTTSIPSIFYEHTPVDWGSTLSRLGLVLMVAWVANAVFHKWKQVSE